MSLSASIHPLAQRELDHEVDYLEAESPGSGLALAVAVEETVRQICDHPAAGMVVRGHIRFRLVVPNARWPYTLYYRVKTDHIRILCLSHQKRQPFYWLGRR